LDLASNALLCNVTIYPSTARLWGNCLFALAHDAPALRPIVFRVLLLGYSVSFTNSLQLTG